MTREQAELLAPDLAGEIDPDYSGRGMYGRTTYAIRTDYRPELVHELIGMWRADGETVSDVSIDSMGLGFVVY